MNITMFITICYLTIITPRGYLFYCGFSLLQNLQPFFDRDPKWRTKVQLLPINCNSSNNFKITKKALEAAYESAIEANIRVKGVIISNPSNPLGTTIDKETLHLLVQFVTNKEIHLVCDEVYFGIVFGKPYDFVGVAKVINEVGT